MASGNKSWLDKLKTLKLTKVVQGSLLLPPVLMFLAMPKFGIAYVYRN